MRNEADNAALMEGHPWDTATGHLAMVATLSTGRAWVKAHDQSPTLTTVTQNKSRHT